MDIDSLLDALQAAYVTGTLTPRSMSSLARSAAVSPAEMICRLLETSPPGRQWLPATAARCVQEPRVAEALLRTAHADGATPARRAALASLIDLQYETARDAAIEIMGDTAAPSDMRAAAADILGVRADAQTLARLHELLADGAPGTRRLAAWVLGVHGGDTDIDRLEAAAENDPDSGVRAAASQAHTRALTRSNLDE